MSETETGTSAECTACEHDLLVQTAVSSKWLRLAVVLVAGTMLYNIAEAVVATIWGSKAESIALFGFGLDSIIECAAATVMLWRLVVQLRGADGEALERSERIVRRFIGGTFLALALYMVVQASWTLWKKEPPNASPVGIVLAIASLIIMPAIAIGKLRVARELQSKALRAEAKETLVCSYLSFTLLLGLGANAVAGWWWADPVAALFMVPWLIMEGREGIRGEECCDGD
jgi:divalent metal cation (Fe/Co/Zn/Cd) transporter